MYMIPLHGSSSLLNTELTNILYIFTRVFHLEHTASAVSASFHQFLDMIQLFTVSQSTR